MKPRFSLHETRIRQTLSYGILDSKHMLYAPFCSSTNTYIQREVQRFNELDGSDNYYWVPLTLKEIIIYHRTGKVKETPDMKTSRPQTLATRDAPIFQSTP
jgi:hypothetical protein